MCFPRPSEHTSGWLRRARLLVFEYFQQPVSVAWSFHAPDVWILGHRTPCGNNRMLVAGVSFEFFCIRRVQSLLCHSAYIRFSVRCLCCQCTWAFAKEHWWVVWSLGM